MKKVIALVLIVTMGLSLVGCGGGNQPTTTATTATDAAETTAAGTTTSETVEKTEAVNDAKDGLLIGLAMHNQTADWAVQFKDSFIEEAKKNGDEVTWNDANSVAATQVSNIEDLIAQNIDVLVVDPADYTALGQALKAAQDAGIKVVNVDSKVDEADQGYIASFVTADCYKGGYYLGEYLADKLPKDVTIGALNYPQIAVIADRFIGMQDAFNEKGRTDIKVIDKTCTDLNAIATYTEDMLMANPEISCFVCLNDNTALSCYATCAQMDKADCLVYGFDGSPAGKQSISNGEMAGTMVYSPVDLAIKSCDTAHAVATDGAFDQETLIDMWLINPDNIGERKLDAWE